jgi:hypothetical protein
MLPDVVTEPATIEEPLHDPRNPAHERIRTAWWDYAGAEKHFAEDNPDAARRLQSARLPQSIVLWAIENKNVQLAYFLAHRNNLEYARYLAQLPTRDLHEKLEELAESLLHNEDIPIEERGVVRAGDLSTDRYLEHRRSGKSIPRKQLPRSRENLDADDYIALRKGERKELRRLKGHR